MFTSGVVWNMSKDVDFQPVLPLPRTDESLVGRFLISFYLL